MDVTWQHSRQPVLAVNTELLWSQILPCASNAAYTDPLSYESLNHCMLEFYKHSQIHFLTETTAVLTITPLTDSPPPWPPHQWHTRDSHSLGSHFLAEGSTRPYMRVVIPHTSHCTCSHTSTPHPWLCPMGIVQVVTLPPFTADGGTKMGGGLNLTPDGWCTANQCPTAAAAGSQQKDKQTKSLPLIKPTEASLGIWDHGAKHKHTEKATKVAAHCLLSAS